MKRVKYCKSLKLALPVVSLMLILFQSVWVMPAYAAIFQKLSIKGDNYQIPAILTLPDTKTAKPLSIVIMLHGTASQKNEVGDLFKQMATQLANQHIASIRFDFAGSGDSTVNYSEYDLESALNDLIAVYKFIEHQNNIEHNKIHLLGFSQGGLIAQLAAVHPQLPVVSIATWSTVAGNGISSFQPFFEQYEQEAIENGFALIKYPWLDKALHFSDKWFKQIRQNTSLSQMANYQGTLLAIAGEADQTVPWQNSLSLIKASKKATASMYLIKNANHIFNVLEKNGSGLNADQSITEELLGITSHYFFEQTIK